MSTSYPNELELDTTGNPNRSQWNTRYRAPRSELSLKKPISNTSLCLCGTSCIWNFCLRRIVSLGSPEPGLLEAVPPLAHYSQQSCAEHAFLPNLFAISRKENTPRNPITRPRSNSLVADNGFFVFLKTFLANTKSIRQNSETNNAHELYSTHLRQP
ncbi:hypothetical protein TNCV_4843571 [Trichonephila clavipes]|uniref:Uncharacterized protein n=1 Tax=Trichonephila clavipes TaxID=2585209 RepID=A0A8X7BLV6_TRICX|nr:hypothetical protein TNCV_4843571 [Trichonephila clavipes]